MVTPRYVVSYSTDVVFKSETFSKLLCAFIFNKEEDVSFLCLNAFASCSILMKLQLMNFQS